MRLGLPGDRVERPGRARRPRAGSHPAPGSLGSPSAPTKRGCLQWLDEAALRGAKAPPTGQPAWAGDEPVWRAGIKAPRAVRKYGPEVWKTPQTERRGAQRLLTRRPAL